MCYHKSFKSDVEELSVYFPQLVLKTMNRGKWRLRQRTYFGFYACQPPHHLPG